MLSEEGVVKYRLDFTKKDSVPKKAIRYLNAWRHLCRSAGLIGQDDSRYDGAGFGNISCRLKETGEAFIISGTQTGHLFNLTTRQYAIVHRCIFAENRVLAEGAVRPSSEAMTHAAVYNADCRIQVVIHAHAPNLWRSAARLGLPYTSEEIPYGTPQMSVEVDRLFKETSVRERRVFVMGGHEDGVVAFGKDAQSAGTVLFAAVADALALEY